MAGMLKAAQAAQPAEGGEDMSPAFQQAMQFAMQALYGDGAAARDVVQGLRAAPNVADGLADTTYRMVEIVDERTQGAVPDEELIALASAILGEVAEIAEAGGLQVNGQAIADAMRNMLIRYVTEQGMDAAQLQAAMGQVDTAALGAALEKQGA